MPTLASTSTREVSPVNGFPGENSLRDLQFKLAHNLQSTLDVHTTLELFFSNIQEAVTISGIEYQLPKTAAPITLGPQEQHTARYTLNTNKNNIGTIAFKRNKRFLEAELAVLEMLISVLYFPLRNALLYRDALESSQRDPLTGIGNRAALDINFSREIKLAQRHGTPLSLLVIDVDHFKNINDEFGHRTGDNVLKHVVNGIYQTLRETDQIFRFGGEEFVVLLNNTCKSAAKLAAERIRIQCAMNPYSKNSNDIPVTISLGVSALKEHDTTESLFERADTGVYKAKRAGRNRAICVD